MEVLTSRCALTREAGSPNSRHSSAHNFRYASSCSAGHGWEPSFSASMPMELELSWKADVEGALCQHRPAAIT
ncbi:hypothetical protein GCM10020001_108160 [Nonomuraea salmonea]